MRNKYMTYGEFSGIQQYNGSGVRLSQKSRPAWMKKVPTAITLASGTSGTGIPYCSTGMIVGGIDTYRLSPEDPVDYNKDHYIVLSGLNPSGLLAIGPSKDSEHWTNTIPSYDWDL